MFFEFFDRREWFLLHVVGWYSGGIAGTVDVVEDEENGEGDGDVFAFDVGEEAFGVNHGLWRTEVANSETMGYCFRTNKIVLSNVARLNWLVILFDIVSGGNLALHS